eukprot:scaffold11574_cov124-Isochrysis_galbana.AAC.2
MPAPSGSIAPPGEADMRAVARGVTPIVDAMASTPAQRITSALHDIRAISHARAARDSADGRRDWRLPVNTTSAAFTCIRYKDRHTTYIAHRVTRRGLTSVKVGKSETPSQRARGGRFGTDSGRRQNSC